MHQNENFNNSITQIAFKNIPYHCFTRSTKQERYLMENEKNAHTFHSHSFYAIVGLNLERIFHQNASCIFFVQYQAVRISAI